MSSAACRGTRWVAGSVDQAAAINNTSRIANLTLVRSTRSYDNDWNNLAPRVGIAWDTRGNGKTAIRAQYGIFYDRLIGATTDFIDTNTPGFSQISTVFPISPPAPISA